MSTELIKSNSLQGQLVPVDKDNPPSDRINEDKERKRNFPPLLKYLKDTCKEIQNLDKTERENLRRSQQRCVAYYDGRQNIKYEDGEWKDRDVGTNYILPEDNQYKIQVDKQNMEMCRSITELDVEPRDKSRSAYKEAAAFIKAEIDAARQRIITASFQQREHLSLLLKTITIRYSFFDAEAEDSPLEKKPKFEQLLIGSKSSLRVCAECGAKTPLSSQPEIETEHTQKVRCPDCGSEETKELSSEPLPLEMPVGYEMVKGGQVKSIHVDPTTVDLDFAGRGIPDSPFLHVRQTFKRGFLEKLYPNIKIPSTEKSEERRWAEASETAVSNDNGYGAWYSDGSDVQMGGRQFEEITVDLYFLDSWVYDEYTNREDEKLPSGKILPADWKLGKAYPDGACIVLAAETVLDLYPVNKNKRWSMCVYGAREHALHGSGTNSLLGPADTINNANAFVLANAYFNANPKEFINPDYISQLPTLEKAGIVQNLPPEAKGIIGFAYDRAPGIPLTAEVYGIREGAMNSLQDHAGTSSLSAQGAADMKSLGTATGVEASRDQAVARMIPNLMLKDEMEEEWAYQIIELEQENYTKERFLRSLQHDREEGDLNYTAEGIEAFLQSNIRADFIIKARPGSSMPKTPAQKRANFAAHAEVVSRIIKMLPPKEGQDIANEMLSLSAESFDQPMNIGGWSASEREAARRLKLLAESVKMREQSGFSDASQEMAVLILLETPQAMISVEMDEHDAYIEFYKDWFVADEGVHASPLLRKVVEVRTIEHRTRGIVGQAQEQAKDMIESQEPVIEKQQEIESQNQPDPEQDVMMALGQHELEKDSREHQTKLEMDKEREKAALQMEQEDQKQGHEVGLEAMRATPEKSA